MIHANLFWIFVVGLVVYLMMKRGGGCCGGHGEHQAPHKQGGDHNSSPDEHHHDHGREKAHDAGKDPVCGMTVSEGAISREFHGRTYRFCSDSCMATFDKDPDKYGGD